jgi:HK97 family phage major capsid protein
MADEKTLTAEEQASIDAANKASDTEVKLEITSDVVERIEESVAKSVEAAMAAKKEFRFHGSKESETKAKALDAKATANLFIKHIAQGRDAWNSEVIHGVHANRSKTITGGVDANGGFLIPTVFETNIEATFDTYSEIIGDADIISFDRPGRVVSLNELVTRVTGFSGVGEDYAMTASTPTYSEPQVAVRNYGGATDITEDFMEDTETDIMSNLSRQYGEEMAKILQADLISGVVTNGITASGIFEKGMGATTVAQATTASGYTVVTPQDLENVYFTAIAIDHFQNANKDGKFYMDPATLQALRSNIRVSTAGKDDISIFDPVEMTILGRPIVMTNQAPTPATTVSDPYVLYGNLGAHLKIARKRGMTMKINTSGTSLGGRNLNYQLGRELVVTQRIGFQTILKNGLVQLVTA